MFFGRIISYYFTGGIIRLHGNPNLSILIKVIPEMIRAR